MKKKHVQKLRQIARRNDVEIVMEFKAFVNNLPFWDRVRVAWKALWRKM